MKIDDIDEALYGLRRARRRALWRQYGRPALYGAIAAAAVLTLGHLSGLW